MLASKRSIRGGARLAASQSAAGKPATATAPAATADLSAATPGGAATSAEVEVEVEAEPTARLRAVIGRLSRRLRPTLAGSGLTPSADLGAVHDRPLRPAAALGGGRDRAAEPDDALADRRAAERRGPDPPQRRPGRPPRGDRPGDAPRAGACASGSTASARARSSAHVEELDEAQRDALWQALPVLEELAERLPGRRR